MKNKIFPCIWFGHEINEAVNFYCDTFPSSKIKQKTSAATVFEIENFTIMALGDVSGKSPNATMSFYVMCETVDEINIIWEKLADNGNILIPIETYPWSAKYGWVEDKYGVSWQLSLGEISDMGQKITPMLMFSGNQYGKAEEAINFYISIFEKSEFHFLSRYKGRDKLQNGKISHGQFNLLGKPFATLDSVIFQDLSFSIGNSIVVNCDTQTEVDYYWSMLTDDDAKSRSGWLKDRFGLSWQIVLSMKRFN